MTTQSSSISGWDKLCVIETLEFFRVLYAEDKVWYGSYQAPALTGTPANVTWETRDGIILSNSGSTDRGKNLLTSNFCQKKTLRQQNATTIVYKKLLRNDTAS